MRVIQHYSFSRDKARQHSRRLQIVFFAFLLTLVLTGTYFYKVSADYQKPSSQTKGAIVSVIKEKTFRTFSDEELKDLYNNFRYANTDKIIEQPSITNDTTADARIRLLAENRGYRLRRLARSVQGVADNLPVQRLSEKSWNDMKAEASKDGIVLTVTSAFRTVEDQRAIFLEGLSQHGVSAQNIATSQVDDLVNKVLQTYAPPGYSRHHTGFTIDLTCGTNGLTNFATTVCHEWLSRDNYVNAKTFGWVPSYPAGVNLQGPEPEPWEFIWVTVDALLE